MTSECKEHQDRIPRSFVGDLSPQEQLLLDHHLAACAPCRGEKERYAETLRLLQSAGDEPVPRHFFVYPEERRATLWQLFRQLTPRWQAAAFATGALLAVLGIATIAGMQIRSDHGTWAVSFGTSAQRGVDPAALKADILRTAEERNREATMVWIRELRSEIGARTNLTQQQQVEMLAALATVENRLNNRIAATAEDIRGGVTRSNAGLYQVLTVQREQDLNRINSRVDRVVEANETKSRQTDEILETLLQIVSNLRQPGEQK
jgi:hypothetical protein